jgi:hypothetical protein
MTLTIGAFSANNLTAQPLGYDQAEVYKGRTARTWTITGLFSSAEWLSLNSVYQTWRNARIEDADSVESGVVGTTVLFSGTGFGESWTNVACWFLEAPSANEQLGTYVSGSVTIVDANEKLAVLLKEKEDENEDLPDLGTITFGTAVVTLTSPPESLGDLPVLEPMAAGGDYVSGPLAPRDVLNVRGYTTPSGWDALVPWAKAALSVTPSTGDYWPTSAPTSTAEHRIVDGVKIVRYNVEMNVAVVK